MSWIPWKYVLGLGLVGFFKCLFIWKTLSVNQSTLIKRTATRPARRIHLIPGALPSTQPEQNICALGIRLVTLVVLDVSNFPFTFVLDLGAYVAIETMQRFLDNNLFATAGLSQKDQI